MPAHIKALLVGPAVTVPIRGGRLALGTWQGIYLGEHRDQGGARTVVVTLLGEAEPSSSQQRRQSTRFRRWPARNARRFSVASAASRGALRSRPSRCAA